MDWSYIAGFFDGEGNIHALVVRSKIGGKKELKCIQLICRLYNSNLNVLEEIYNFIQMGHIYQDKKSKVYELTITKKEQVKFFLENIRNKVISKKDVINFVFDNYDFKVGANNFIFDINRFRSFSPRRNKEKFIKNTSEKIAEEVVALKKPLIS